MTAKTIVVKLQYPVEFADELIEEITLRRATGKDMRAMKGVNGIADSLALASRLSGQLPAVFDIMDAEDVTAVLEEVGNLVAPGRATG